MSGRAPATVEAARAAVQRFPLSRARVVPLGAGLINDTFALDADEGRFVLQRVHPVFSAGVHVDIQAVTEHLAAKGMATPLLLASDQGRPWAEAEDGSVWRVMTRLPGHTFDAVQSPGQAWAAAGMLGRFHGGLVDLTHRFVARRSGVHDTPKHLAYLEAMVAVHAQHRLHVEVSRLTAAILAGAEALPNIDQVPERIVHGDPKLNNVMFEAADGDGAERAFAMIDLDTVAPMALHLELGDAWRSWCNHSGEDANTARFDLAIFEASLRGWADARPFELTASECQALVHGVEWITLELAARFAADALAESYFGWNRSRFPAAGEHNLLRAHGQWSLHAQVLACRRERETLVRARVG